MPATAADVVQLTCPVESLTDSELAELVDHVRRQGSQENEPVAFFFRNVAACRERHRWTPDATLQSVYYNLAEIGQREARRLLEGRGFDVRAIEQALLADRATVDSARTKDGPRRIVAFYDRLDAATRERAAADGEATGLLITCLTFRAMVETSRADFAAQ